MAVNRKSDIRISKENKELMISFIKEYFEKERDEELGDLAAAMILDFIMEKLGPIIYNQGIRDSYEYLSDKLEDMLGLEKF